MSNAKHIKWSDPQRATEHGSVGDIGLFTLSMNSNRSGKRWVLSAKLPGFRTDMGQYDTTEEAKAKAEAVLAAFVQKLGARF